MPPYGQCFSNTERELFSEPDELGGNLFITFGANRGPSAVTILNGDVSIKSDLRSAA